MKIIRVVAACMCLMVVRTHLVQDQGWRGIVPLHSTREDVRRLFGSTEALEEHLSDLYDLGNEVVYITYASGPCDGGWNVPRGTVISINVAPKTELQVASLRLDERTYRKKTHPHMPGITDYTNKEEGVTVETAEGKVMKIYYYPAVKDDHLRCPDNPRATPTEESGAAQAFDKIDVYGDIPFEKEKERLDHLALQLQKTPDMRGYIIAYAGRRTRTGEARARAECAKTYLVNERGIDVERIVTVDGGYREEFTIDLYLVPHGATGPTATPTVDPREIQIIKDSRARNSRRPARPRCKI